MASAGPAAGRGASTATAPAGSGWRSGIPAMASVGSDTTPRQRSRASERVACQPLRSGVGRTESANYSVWLTEDVAGSSPAVGSPPFVAGAIG